MIGNLLNCYRRFYNVTVRDLAKAIGVSPATVSRIEHGKPMDQQTLLKVLNWLFKESP